MSEERGRALAALAARAAAGRPLRLWLRDDDAVEPTPALEALVRLGGAAAVPLCLAVIPAPTGAALADWLAPWDHVSVAQHGWSHQSHAREGEKKQELGPQRPAEMVLAELALGRARLEALYGPRLLPMLVPPWNRIAPGVVDGLPELGFDALSTFGRERAGPEGLVAVNTHLDIIDWHGSRGGRPAAELWQALADLAEGGAETVGVLTHHLVHDAAAWDFLAALLEATSGHEALRWTSAAALITAPPPQGDAGPGRG